MDEITKKRKENMMNEISEILLKINEPTKELIDWYERYENMEILETENGKQLRKCISDLCYSHAYAFMYLSKMEFDDVTKNYPELAQKIANKTTL